MSEVYQEGQTFGRPLEYTPMRIAEITSLLTEYTARTALPLWTEFAYKNKVNFRKAPWLCSQSEDFRVAYEEMHAKEETVIIQGGLPGKLNSPMAQLVLKNHRMSVDYREKEQVDNKDGYENYFQDIKSKAAARKKKREAKP